MARDKVKPTHYPFVPFHLLRSAQLVSALIVASIMFYFLWHLTHDHYRLPWTFILLLAVSLLTILSLSTTIVLHCCCGLNPRLNVCLNGCLLVLWSVGFALLSWWSSGTLSHVCNKSNWEDETGIMVCRIYKALFAFTLLGFVSTFAAALLDVFVFRRATTRGKYNQMQNIDEKRAFDTPNSVPGLGPLPYETQKPFSSQPAHTLGATGYAVPEGQFNYDTGYQGTHETRGL